MKNDECVSTAYTKRNETNNTQVPVILVEVAELCSQIIVNSNCAQLNDNEEEQKKSKQ